MKTDEVFSTIVDFFQKEITKEDLQKGLEFILSKLKDKFGDIDIEHLKMAWNYEEKNTPLYKFSDAVNWFKTNIPKGVRSGGILRVKKDNFIELNLFFNDENDEPVLDGRYPHLVVKSIELDNEFIDKFDDKDLIIIK